MGDKSNGIFANWFKNFTIIVFTQSFHAVYLLFILKFLSIVSEGEISDTTFAENQGLFSIISIAGLAGLIKLEKFIKGLFGIKSSDLLGNIGDNFAKALIGVRSAMDMGRRTIEPFNEYKKAQSNSKAAAKKVDRLRAIQNANLNAPKNTNAAQAAATTTATRVGTGSPVGIEAGSGAGTGTGTGGGNAAITDDALRRLIAALEANSAALQQNGGGKSGESDAVKALKDQYALEDAQEELAKAERDEQAWKKKRFTRLATTVGAAAFGMGATETIGDAVTVANIVDKPLDYMTDKGIDKITSVDAANKALDRKAEAQKAQAREISKLRTKYHLPADSDSVEGLSPEDKAAFKAESEKIRKTYESQIQKQGQMAQEFINDIPKGVVSSMANLWKEAATSTTPVKLTQKDPTRSRLKVSNYRVSVDTEFNRDLAAAARRSPRDTDDLSRRRRPH
mgnify:FL=1